MRDCNDACFCVSQHRPPAMPGEVQEVCVGGNLEIWWCSEPGRKYLQSTIDFGTIIEPNNYFPPAARMGNYKRIPPRCFKQQASNEDWFWMRSKSVEVKRKNCRTQIATKEVRTCRCLQKTTTIQKSAWKPIKASENRLRIFSCKVSLKDYLVLLPWQC